MGKYFGTDGFRGEANVNLTVEHAYKVLWTAGKGLRDQSRWPLPDCNRQGHKKKQLYV